MFPSQRASDKALGRVNSKCKDSTRKLNIPMVLGGVTRARLLPVNRMMAQIGSALGECFWKNANIFRLREFSEMQIAFGEL